MYQAIGIKSKKVYAEGSKPECFRQLNENYPYIMGQKSKSGWGRGGIVTDKPVFKEPIMVFKSEKPLMGGE